MQGCVAVLNAGSSSIKLALYEIGQYEAALFLGPMGQIGVAPRLRVTDNRNEIVAANCSTCGRALSLSHAIASSAPTVRKAFVQPQAIEMALARKPRFVPDAARAIVAMSAQGGDARHMRASRA
jgi:hypothetical protein